MASNILKQASISSGYPRPFGVSVTLVTNTTRSIRSHGGVCIALISKKALDSDFVFKKFRIKQQYFWNKIRRGDKIYESNI